MQSRSRVPRRTKPRLIVRRLLGGFKERRRTGAKLFKQSRFVGLGGREMLQLDVTETANFFRDCGETDGDMVVLRRQPIEDLPRSVCLTQIATGDRSGRDGRAG